MDCKAATQGQFQVVTTEVTEKETSRQKEVKGEGGQNVCYQTNTDGKCNACAGVH